MDTLDPDIYWRAAELIFDKNRDLSCPAISEACFENFASNKSVKDDSVYYLVHWKDAYRPLNTISLWWWAGDTIGNTEEGRLHRTTALLLMVAILEEEQDIDGGCYTLNGY